MDFAYNVDRVVNGKRPSGLSPFTRVLFGSELEKEVQMDRAMKICEVASVLRCSVPTAYEIVRSGKLPAARVGKMWRVSEVAVQRFLNGGGSGGGTGEPQEPRQTL